ncbi:unnamed protein product [Pleuronectes platessa]|uniref:Uncharacterized protein n=1 Tax=Pleuronectes platessa TaxID=8262 RepID=A0A9N7Y8Z4_PLEPL|nr:unnamed protein product [Pleuronectes platessa]
MPERQEITELQHSILPEQIIDWKIHEGREQESRHLSGRINMPIVEAETPGTPLNVDSTEWKNAAAAQAPAPPAPRSGAALGSCGCCRQASAHLTLFQSDMLQDCIS